MLSLIFILPITTFAMTEKTILNGSALTITSQETITRQSVNCSLYQKHYSDKKYSLPSKLAHISYELENPTTISLNHFKIEERKNRNQGLGKVIFTFFMHHVQEKNPEITTVVLQSVTLDSLYLPQDALEQWYSNRGGIRIGPHPGGGSIFVFKVKTFKPEGDVTSLLASCKVHEFATIESVHAYTLITEDNRSIATLACKLFINLVHADDENKTTYQVIINKTMVDEAYMYKKEDIEKILKHEMFKTIAAKKWLKIRSKL